MSWGGLPLIADPAERRRFLDGKPAVVLGTLAHHPFAQIWASFRNAVWQLQSYGIADEVARPLIGLLNADSNRTMRVVQMVPNIQPCLANRGRACDH